MRKWRPTESNPPDGGPENESSQFLLQLAAYIPHQYSVCARKHTWTDSAIPSCGWCTRSCTSNDSRYCRFSGGQWLTQGHTFKTRTRIWRPCSKLIVQAQQNFQPTVQTSGWCSLVITLSLLFKTYHSTNPQWQVFIPILQNKAAIRSYTSECGDAYHVRAFHSPDTRHQGLWNNIFCSLQTIHILPGLHTTTTGQGTK